MDEFGTGLRELRNRYLKRYPKKAATLERVCEAVRKQREEGQFPEGVGWGAVEDAFRIEFARRTAKSPARSRKRGSK